MKKANQIIKGCLAALFLISSSMVYSNPVTLVGPDGNRTAKKEWIWGVTTDAPYARTAQQVDVLASFSKRVMLRTVFDKEMPASEYMYSVIALSSVADIMGQLLDSSDMADTDLATVRMRANEYLNMLGNLVKVWEIGNEVNGEWLGPKPIKKIEAMYDAVKARGQQTAITFYYDTEPPEKEYDMFEWITKNIPVGHRMRSGLDYVLVSYYEDQNSGHILSQMEVNTIFTTLARIFPNAKLGFGEFGWGERIPKNARASALRARLINRFYSYKVPSVPNFIGGGFYWHFRQTMTPKTDPDWKVLDTIIRRN